MDKESKEIIFLFDLISYTKLHYEDTLTSLPLFTFLYQVLDQDVLYKVAHARVTSMEHLTSSTDGHIIKGFPVPKGFLSSVIPADIEDASSVIHFSSNEPNEENCTIEKHKKIRNGTSSGCTLSKVLNNKVRDNMQDA